MKIFMPLGDATEAMDTFYPYYRLQEDNIDVVVAGPEARLYHTVLHEIPPDSSIPWDITQERPGYFIKATLAFRDAKGADFAGAFVSGGRAPEYIRYNQDLLRVMREIHQAGKPIACVCHGIEILRSEEHTSELQSLRHLVCRLLLEKKKVRRSDIIDYLYVRAHLDTTFGTVTL